MVEPIVFTPWAKVPRLNRRIVITEKIDGTNAAIGITEELVYAQSRSRIITPGKSTDNFGFAQWVADRADELREVLGIGLHYGEWWGNGIQRGYGLEKDDKRFSLFNTERWAFLAGYSRGGLSVVPVLFEGVFSDIAIRHTLNRLDAHGSSAAPGFMKPEGIVIFHTAANAMFKVTIEGDEKPKSLDEAAGALIGPAVEALVEAVESV